MNSVFWKALEESAWVSTVNLWQKSKNMKIQEKTEQQKEPIKKQYYTASKYPGISGVVFMRKIKRKYFWKIRESILHVASGC